MDANELVPGARRDNAGLVSVPAELKPGCKGLACPAFALCHGRCETKRSERVLRSLVTDAEPDVALAC